MYSILNRFGESGFAHKGRVIKKAEYTVPNMRRYAVKLGSWLDDEESKRALECLDERMRTLGDERDWSFEGSFGNMNLIVNVEVNEAYFHLSAFVVAGILTEEYDPDCVSVEDICEYSIISKAEMTVDVEQEEEFRKLRDLLENFVDKKSLLAMLNDYVADIENSKNTAEDFCVEDNGSRIWLIKAIRPDDEGNE